MKENKIDQYDSKLTSAYTFNYRKGSLIEKNGKEIFLEHRLKEFLAILLNNKNEVVTRDELMAFVWKDVIVSDESVTKAASDLRKFFVNNEMNGFKLITISKRGYKLEITDAAADLVKSNYVKRSLKGIGYVLLVFIVIIILIRAAKY